MAENKGGSSKTGMIGERFGKLTVVGLSEERIKNALTYECLCDCGNRILATSIKLRAGKITTCGDCFLSRVYHGEASNYEGYVVLMRSDCDDGKVYLGKLDRFDRSKHYNNIDNSLVFVSDNRKMFSFLTATGWTYNQQELIEKGVFSAEDYAEFANLKETVLTQFTVIREIKFGMDIKLPDSGVPFAFPVWNNQ